MARIEISLDEYHSMRDRIKTLENEIYNIKKEHEALTKDYDNLVFDLSELKELDIYTRAFNFKETVNRLLEFYGKKA